MLKTIAKTVAVLALLAAPLAAHEEDGGMNMEVVPVLTVSGSGQARVTPDEATVRLGVTAQAPTARAAQEQVNRVANAILAAVRTLGVEAKDIQTSDLSLNPVYSQGRGQELQEPRITGYQASNVVSIRLEDLTKVGPVIDVGLSSGANRLEGVFFGLRNDQAARAEALTDAVREARSKAEALARALRVRLLEIIEVAEGGVTISPPPTPFRGRVAMAEMAMDSSTPVSAGEVGVEASVTLRYRIAPCAEGQPCP
jgi:uncharacterized protein YggE